MNWIRSKKLKNEQKVFLSRGGLTSNILLLNRPATENLPEDQKLSRQNEYERVQHWKSKNMEHLRQFKSSPSQTDVNKEGPWKSFGSSMNAISFGFVATAILISMFLIMAIFEHLFRPNASHNESSHGMESRQMQKLGNSDILSLASSSLVLCSFFPQPSAPVVQTAHASDFSVVMPGQQYPTFIAHLLR
ncbi:hypothetical protein Sango_0940900 [Sesamum angolense]|uniref:Uncharacterized protein n=1 Tax=Sesamum angolense TaxID=2727404 RepID=A0AAE2BY35_9LAMI|nr:hypothetical protein Sango_0940900 [Sesamum angolense]